ncbi:MAG: hypothetical protein EBQ96_03550 [Proteobacteria bacterium]|nr:hypothetical protein [Pseudomonadota bacterium]
MRLTYKAGLFVLALGLIALGPLHAQENEGTDSTTRLMQFAANNVDFDKTVEARALELFTKQITACATPEKAVRQLPRTYGELQFPKDPKGQFPYPTQGVWSEHVKIKGCGRIWSINMLAVARDTGKAPLLLALMPGDTLADPAVQKTTERIGATAIKKADAESCADDAFATYSKIIGYLMADGTLTKKDAGHGWFEEWTYKFCQKDVPVQVAFTPNGGGYDIKARIVPSAMPKVPTQKPVTAKDIPAQKSAAPEPARDRSGEPKAAPSPLEPEAPPIKMDPLN